MIIFNGKYSWDGKKDGVHKPVSWWPGSHYLTIVDFSLEKTECGDAQSCHCYGGGNERGIFH